MICDIRDSLLELFRGSYFKPYTRHCAVLLVHEDRGFCLSRIHGDIRKHVPMDGNATGWTKLMQAEVWKIECSPESASMWRKASPATEKGLSTEMGKAVERESKATRKTMTQAEFCLRLKELQELPQRISDM